MNGLNKGMNILPPTRLEKVESALKQLIDYTLALNKIAVEKGLWSMEEFNRAASDMDKERRMLSNLGHDAGMKVMFIAKKLGEFKPRKEG